jgi:hypothetical protein
MLVAHLATIAAALFAGAAIYINVAEQPARLSLPDGPMLAQWQASYPRAATMRASLAVIGGVLAIASYAVLGNWRWLLAALLMLANCPYTLVVIKPINDALHGMQASTAGGDARRLIETWGTLHAGRSALGAAARLRLGACLEQFRVDVCHPGIRRRRISGTQEQQGRACIGSPGSRMAAARPPG